MENLPKITSSKITSLEATSREVTSRGVTSPEVTSRQVASSKTILPQIVFLKKLVYFMFMAVFLSSCDFKMTAGTADACESVGDILRMSQLTQLYIPEEVSLAPEDIAQTNTGVAGGMGAMPEKQWGIASQMVRAIPIITKGTVEKIYKNATSNAEYQGIVTAAFLLSAIIYAACLAVGAAHIDAWEIIKKIVMFGVIFALITDWDIFNTFIFAPSNYLVDGMIALFGNLFTSQEFGGFNGIFAGADKILSVIFSSGFHKIIAASIVSGFGGFFMGLMLFFLFFTLFSVVLDVVKIFLVAYIGRILLLAILPIILLSLLFANTKSIFDGWLEQFMNLTLQPIMQVAALGLMFAIIIGLFPSIYPQDLYSDQGKEVYVCFMKGPILPFHWYYFVEGRLPDKNLLERFLSNRTGLMFVEGVLNTQKMASGAPLNFNIATMMVVLGMLTIRVPEALRSAVAGMAKTPGQTLPVEVVKDIAKWVGNLAGWVAGQFSDGVKIPGLGGKKEGLFKDIANLAGGTTKRRNIIANILNPSDSEGGSKIVNLKDTVAKIVNVKKP
jgi:type IV secretory pathway VirB6-like protein